MLLVTNYTTFPLGFKFLFKMLSYLICTSLHHTCYSKCDLLLITSQLLSTNTVNNLIFYIYSLSIQVTQEKSLWA